MSTVLVLATSLALAGAEPPPVVHQPPECVVEGRAPLLTARTLPDRSVVVRFRHAGTLHWYGIQAKDPSGEVSIGLPELKPGARAIEYVFDLREEGRTTWRSPLYRVPVALDELCGGHGTAAPQARRKAEAFALPRAPNPPFGFRNKVRYVVAPTSLTTLLSEEVEGPASGEGEKP